MKRILTLILCCIMIFMCTLIGCTEEKDPDNDDLVTALKCETVCLVKGENKFEISIGNDTFKKEIETISRAITLTLGEKTIAVSNVKFIDEETIEVTFVISDDFIFDDAKMEGINVSINGAALESGKSIDGIALVLISNVEASFVIAGSSAFDVTLKLYDGVFTNPNVNDFNLLGPFENMSVVNVLKKTEEEAVLSISGEMELSCDGYPYTFGIIEIKRSGISSIVDLTAYAPFVFPSAYWNCNETHNENDKDINENVFNNVTVDSKENVILALENCKFANDITKDKFIVLGTEEISIKNVTRLDDMNVWIEFDNQTDKDLYLFDGAIEIVADGTTALQKLHTSFATLDDLHKVESDHLLTVSDPNSYNLFGFNYDFSDILKASLNAIPSTIVGSLFEKGINAIFGIESEDSKKLDKLLDNMSEINNKMAQLDVDIKQLIDKVDAQAFQQQMRDVQNVVERLNANISGYQGGAKVLAKLTPGSDEYNNELKIYADVINANGTFYQDTFQLGSKLLSDASGSGAIVAHRDYILKTYNWERGTYMPRQEFFVYVIGPYYQSVAYNLIALKYVTETSSSPVEIGSANAKIEQITSQVDKVKEMVENTQIKYLKDEYNVSLKTNIIIKNNIDGYSYHRNNYFIDFSKMGRTSGEKEFSCPETHLLSKNDAARLQSYAKGKTLLQDMQQGGCTLTCSNSLPVMTCDYLIVQQVTVIPNMYGPTQYIINHSGYYYLYSDHLIKELAPTTLFSGSLKAAIPQYVGERYSWLSFLHVYDYLYK